jgi:hypothetical protein
MNDADERSDTAGGDAGTTLDFEEGRYVYCAVRAGEDATFAATGLEGGDVTLFARDGVGVVVQAVDSVFDSDDVTQVRSWLLDHQQVVDDAGQQFGTPLPFRFDTILKGGDATVSEWLETHRAELEEALEWLAGRWEYRIRLEWDAGAIADEILEADDELREMAERADSADEGTGFLLEKQYQQQLSERVEAHRSAVEAQLHEDVEPYAVERQRSGRASMLSEGDEDDGETETVADLSILADREDETAIGDALEPFAEHDAYEVSYTGPWPPYSFAPEIGAEIGADDGGAETP